jgi:L-rhamnose mutarotase
MKFKERMKKPDEVEIDIEDVELIMDNDFSKLHIYLDSAYCGICEKHSTTIEDYTIYLNNLNDLIFQGKCIRCKNPVVRYIETGEDEEKAKIAKHIRAIKKDFKVEE